MEKKNGHAAGANFKLSIKSGKIELAATPWCRKEKINYRRCLGHHLSENPKPWSTANEKKKPWQNEISRKDWKKKRMERKKEEGQKVSLAAHWFSQRENCSAIRWGKGRKKRKTDDETDLWAEKRNGHYFLEKKRGVKWSNGEKWEGKQDIYYLSRSCYSWSRKLWQKQFLILFGFFARCPNSNKKERKIPGGNKTTEVRFFPQIYPNNDVSH